MIHPHQPIYDEFGKERTNAKRRQLTTELGCAPNYLKLYVALCLEDRPPKPDPASDGGEGARMTEKFTPGPWSVTPNANDPPDTFFIDYGKRRKRHVCFVTSNGRQRVGEVIANARLIASAPDLLAALQAVEWVQEFDQVDDDAGNWCQLCHNMEREGHAEGCAIDAAIAKATGAET